MALEMDENKGVWVVEKWAPNIAFLFVYNVVILLVFGISFDCTDFKHAVEKIPLVNVAVVCFIPITTASLMSHASRFPPSILLFEISGR